MTFILRKEVENNGRQIITESQFLNLIQGQLVMNVQFSAQWGVRIWFIDKTSLFIHDEGSAYVNYVDYLDGSNFSRDMRSLVEAVDNSKKSR
jgi:hypothetical protein